MLSLWIGAVMSVIGTLLISTVLVLSDFGTKEHPYGNIFVLLCGMIAVMLGTFIIIMFYKREGSNLK